MTPAEVRARLLRFLRRMPCGVGYAPNGFAHHTSLGARAVKALLEQMRADGIVKVDYPALPYYSPVRAACVPGKRCKRPACRLHREAKRLAALADKVAAS